MHRWFKVCWYLLITGTLLWASGIIPAIIPQAVPTAFRQGPAAGSKFALTTGAFTIGNCRKTAADGSEIDSGAACGGGGALDNVIQSKGATGALTLTVAPQDIPGAAITLSRAGVWSVTGQCDFNVAAGEFTWPLFCNLSGPGTVAGPGSLEDVSSVTRQALGATWMYTSSGAADVIKLQGWKLGGAGGTTIEPAYTFFTAVWVSP